MKKRLSTDMRLVRCPRCSKLLPEPSDVPLYTCGGCDTILQSKYYKKEDGRKQAVLKEFSNGHHHGGESSGSSPQSILSAQHSPDPCGEALNCNLEQLGPPNSTREASSLNDACIADTKDSSSHLATEDGKLGEKQCVEQYVDREAPLSNDANSLGKHEEVSEPAPNFEDVGRSEKLVERQPGAGSCSSGTAELESSSGHRRGGESSGSSPQSFFSASHSPDPCGEAQNCNLEQLGSPNSTKEASSLNDPCTADTKDSSSHLATEDGKLGEKQCVDREAPFSNDSNSLGKHEEVSGPTPNFEDVGRGENLVERQPGAGSCSSGTAQLDASSTVAPFDEKALSNGDVEQEGEGNVVVNYGSEKTGIGSFEREVSSSDESRVPESNKSLPLPTAEDQEGEADDAVKVGGLRSEVATSSKESTLLQCEGVSGLPLGNQERVNGIDIRGVNSDIITTSDEPSVLENKEVSGILMENQEINVGKVKHGPSETKDEHFDGPQTETISSTLVESHERDESPCVAPGEENVSDDGKDQSKVADCAGNLVDGTNLSAKAVLSSDPDRNGKDEALQPLEADAITSENRSIPPIPVSNTLVVNEEPTSATKLSDAVGGDASWQNIVGSDQKTIPTGLGSVTSAKKQEGPELVNAKSEVTNSPNILPRSPTRKSLAYDGSVSSCDGNDDQSLHMDTEILGRASEVEDQVTAEGERHDRFPANPLDHHYEGTSSNQHNIPGTLLNNAENLEAVGRGSAFRRNRWPSTEEHLPSGYSLYLTNSELAYESSVSSIAMHGEFQSHSISHHPPHCNWCIETGAMRRPRRRSDVEVRTLSNSSWVREGVSIHPYCESACEMYPTPRYQRYRYPVVRKEETRLPFRIPYSGEALRRRYQQFHDPYLHFRPSSELRWSSRFSSPGCYYSRGWNSLRSWKPLDSYPTSPQFIDSDSNGWGYDVFSDDPRHNDQMVMNRLQKRKKQQSGQRHFRPVAGGAPFVTCYICSELLQLPSDFLLFKSRRIHRLKCASCSRILEFQLEKGEHLVPYAPKASATPSEAIEGEITRRSTSQQTNINHCETPQQSNTSSVTRSRVQYAAEGPIHDSSQARERQRSKRGGQNSQIKGKMAMVESGGEARSSWAHNMPRLMKVSGEHPSTSPLHWLMGYSSPSQVFYGHGSKRS